MSGFRILVLAGALALVLSTAVPARADDSLIVQGTTSVRDTGLLTQLVIPMFEEAHPEITLKYVAVGSGQAITNAELGQGDALLTHEPIGEAQFVAGGYSDGPGRLVLYSRFVIAGPTDDVAGVARGAGQDLVTALEVIAKAGAAGEADFVSRGDASGTNVKELTMWSLGATPLTPTGEPASSSAWYHKAQTGMGATLRVAEQCPFASHECYVLTDLPTLRALQRTQAVTHLRVLEQGTRGSTRGGAFANINPFHYYVVNPAKTGHGNVAAAEAFGDFLTSPQFQRALLTYPTASERYFTPAARPRVSLMTRWPTAPLRAGPLRIAGVAASVLPGAKPLRGTISLLRRKGAGWVRVTRTALGAGGEFAMTIHARAGFYRLSLPPSADVQLQTRDLGSLRIER
jgi:tungstate transport system substrate-binding protein